MTGTLKLAWRNLGRNRRRTIITGVALTVGTSLCVGTYGLMDGMNADILHALTRLDLGHVQLHHPAYPVKKGLRYTLSAPQELGKALERQPRLRGWTRRVYAFGLVSHGHKSAGVQLVGVDPHNEVMVTELHQTMQEGRYLDDKPAPWPRGEALTEAQKARDEAITAKAEAAVLAEIDALMGEGGDDGSVGGTSGAGSAGDGAGGDGGGGDGAAGATAQIDALTRKLANRLDPPPKRAPNVFLGRDLARILDVELGGKVYVMTQTVDGMAAEVSLRVTGIIHTGTSQYDRGRIYMHIEDLQRFVHLYDRVHEIAAAVMKPSQAGAVAEAVRQRLGDRALAAPDGSKAAVSATAENKILVRAWGTIRPDIRSILQLNDAGTVLMVLVIFVVAALGVVNTMLMAVFERTRELGMLKAVGMSGGQIILLILTETLLLTVVASAVGTGLGVGLDLYMMIRGIDLSAVSGGISIGGVGLNPVIHGVITARGVVLPAVILSALCFVGAFYPAARAARLRPAQGMREM